MYKDLRLSAGNDDDHEHNDDAAHNEHNEHDGGNHPEAPKPLFFKN